MNVPDAHASSMLTHRDAEIRAATLRNDSTSSIALRHGISRERVYDAVERLAERGLLRRGMSAAKAREQAMALAWNAEVPTSVIAERHGISRQRVHQIARKLGLPARGRLLANPPLPKELTVSHAEIAAQYEAGDSTMAILAERHGVTVALVKKCLVMHGVDAKYGRERLTPVQVKRRHLKWLSDYQRGMSYTQVAGKHGVGVMTVYRALKRMGAATRNKAEAIRLRTAELYGEIDRDAIERDYAAGLSAKQVAIKHDISESRVKTIVRKVPGLMRRPRTVRRYAPSIAAEVQAEYATGAKASEIAAKRGMSTATVSRMVRRVPGLARSKGPRTAV